MLVVVSMRWCGTETDRRRIAISSGAEAPGFKVFRQESHGEFRGALVGLSGDLSGDSGRYIVISGPALNAPGVQGIILQGWFETSLR